MSIKSLLFQQIETFRILASRARLRGDSSQAKVYDEQVYSLLKEYFPERIAADETSIIQEQPGAQPTRARVLIADDESLVRMDLRDMLTNLGYLVVGEVGDGRSAVNLAHILRPDIVVMDIMMPDMDGIEAAKVLIEDRVAPVLLLSVYSQQDLVRRAQKAGVAGYLVKPFRESDLAPAIEVAMARFSEFSAMEHEVNNLQEALEIFKAVDRARGILMDTQGLNEIEAFRKIQKMSMNNRESMRTVADAIIDQYERSGSN